ncbi:MAG: hypothetical protein Q4C70_06790 [Planctomycetia bacterium]|nr:hypothetical protein [Planctomycetia bacterium]
MQNTSGNDVYIGKVYDRTLNQWVLAVNGKSVWPVTHEDFFTCWSFRDFWWRHLARTSVDNIDEIAGANWVECELAKPTPETPTDEKYQNVLEFYPIDQQRSEVGYPMDFFKSNTLADGAKVVCLADSTEFPPLEDWNHPFWYSLRENMPSEGVDVRIRFRFPNPCAVNEEIPVETVVRIKPRCEEEIKQIRSWYHSTPEEFFPKEQFSMKSWLQSSIIDTNPNPKRNRRYLLKRLSVEEVAEPWGYPITISGKKGENIEVMPWFFMRIGNRKLFGSGVPKDLTGWRRLEESWTPGTMRDEMKMTRFLIEICETEANHLKLHNGRLTGH